MFLFWILHVTRVLGVLVSTNNIHNITYLKYRNYNGFRIKRTVIINSIEIKILFNCMEFSQLSIN
jgi:hypothetical protein